MQQGVQQGEVLATRSNLLIILIARFGESAIDLRESVQKINDLAFLGLLLQRAATATSLAEFRQLLA